MAKPNKHDGRGFRRIISRDDGAELYGAWSLIIEVASKCPQRGILADEDGPLTAADLADKTGAPAELFDRALDVLTDRKIGWLVRKQWNGAECHSIALEQTGATGHDHEDHDQDQTEQTNKVHGAGNVDRIEIRKEDISGLAGRIFAKCGYHGDDGGNLWKAAALACAGLVTENEIWTAARGAELKGRDKPAYFFTCLAESVEKRGQQLTDLLRKVRIVPDWPRSPPAPPEMPGYLADALKKMTSPR